MDNTFDRVTSKISTFIDEDRGLLIDVETEKNFEKKIDIESFYKTFIEYISPLFNLNNHSTKNVLIWMCTHANPTNGICMLPTSIRKELCQELNINNSNLSTTINKLKELDLISGQNGLFEINPKIFWKGNADAQKELLNEGYLKISIKINDDA